MAIATPERPLVDYKNFVIPDPPAELGRRVKLLADSGADIILSSPDLALMIKTRRPPDCLEDNFKDATRSQAIDMASYADVPLTDDDIRLYSTFREKMPLEPRDEQDTAIHFWNVSDQVLMASVFCASDNSNYRFDKFTSAYPYIFRSHLG